MLSAKALLKSFQSNEVVSSVIVINRTLRPPKVHQQVSLLSSSQMLDLIHLSLMTIGLHLISRVVEITLRQNLLGESSEVAG